MPEAEKEDAGCEVELVPENLMSKILVLDMDSRAKVEDFESVFMVDTHIEYCDVSVKVIEIFQEGYHVEKLENPDSTKMLCRVVPSVFKGLDSFEDETVRLAALKAGHDILMRMFRQEIVDPGLLLEIVESFE